MLLDVSIYDSRNARRGSVQIQMDFATRQWLIPAGQQVGWAGVGYSNPPQGSFEVRDNHVIWLWDQRPGQHNLLIIWDPPTGESDLTHRAGEGRIDEPRDADFKGGKITWTAAPSAKAGLAPIRQRVLDLITAIPFKFGPAYKANFPNPRPAGAKIGVSNCGEFPGWITKHIGGSNAPADILKFRFHDQWGDYALTAPMTGWELWAAKLQAHRGKGVPPVWINYSDAAHPLPGDIYVLHGWKDVVINSKPSKMYGFAHVGIVIDGTKSTWITADCGQGEGDGKGFSGCYQRRIFANGKLTLAGYNSGDAMPLPDAGTKDIKGWVDLENLFTGWKPS